MRYIFDVPRTYNQLLEDVARDEQVPPRDILIWLFKAEILARYKQLHPDQPEPVAA